MNKELTREEAVKILLMFHHYVVYSRGGKKLMMQDAVDFLKHILPDDRIISFEEVLAVFGVQKVEIDEAMDDFIEYLEKNL